MDDVCMFLQSGLYRNVIIQRAASNRFARRLRSAGIRVLKSNTFARGMQRLSVEVTTKCLLCLKQSAILNHLLTDRVSGQRAAIGRVRPSSRPSVFDL